jgi:Cu(I)/Ag(I) efflux system membrane fusion protein
MLGSESDTVEESARLFATLSEHFEGFRNDFPATRIALRTPPALSAPPKFRQQLGKTLQSYLVLQQSLSVDDFQSAKTASDALARNLRSIDAGLLKDQARDAWKQALVSIDAGRDRVVAAKDISAIRSGFDLVSAGISEAIVCLGVEIKGPVFEIFCPMAFDSRGATWLQQDKNIRNPYFGASMLECGEVRRMIKGEAS